MINVGEQLVASYLRYIRDCEFTQLNLYTVDTQGEIDVVGIDLETRRLFVCEVAVHLTTGLQYVKNKRPNNIAKLTQKFSRDIAYANRFFPEYEKHFMLWSPVVKASKPGSLYNQMDHVAQIEANLLSEFGIQLDLIINERFEACLQEMRSYASKQTAELKCPVMRLFQIEAHLKKHLGK
ncbi:hypothetical protein [Roseiconus lacunae]|uniref:hypothetical protein n=1 Tax=Roseiconus lacunae TaxID=2605694 RepID=UPI0011F0C9C2|nr:hypothetical protein [Roseiconus lacunae]